MPRARPRATSGLVVVMDRMWCSPSSGGTADARSRRRTRTDAHAVRDGSVTDSAGPTLTIDSPRGRAGIRPPGDGRHAGPGGLRHPLRTPTGRAPEGSRLSPRHGRFVPGASEAHEGAHLARRSDPMAVPPQTTAPPAPAPAGGTDGAVDVRLPVRDLRKVRDPRKVRNRQQVRDRQKRRPDSRSAFSSWSIRRWMALASARALEASAYMP